ncbi:MAG: T9SS type A sorting domain-containing protein [Candidatus Zixiibacteriota bacterium]
MMKTNIFRSLFNATLFITLISSPGFLVAASGQTESSSYAAPSRIDVQPDMIDGWVPFSIDIYMKNVFQEFLGCSIPLVFYSPDNSIHNITHYNVGGYSAEGHSDSSIMMFNNFDDYWPLINQWTGFSWDGQLPDTINFTGAGVTGWQPHDDYIKYFGFNLRTDEIGMLCIDSCSIPGGVEPGQYDWLFETDNFTFGGPYCWQIGDYIPRLEYLTMLGPDTLPEGSQAAYSCVASYVYFCCIDDVTLNSCDVEWSLDCPPGEIDSCGIFSVSLIDSTITCRINASFTDDDITVNTYKEITILDTSILSATTEETGRLPEDFVLGQNRPNPFNASTRIEFGLPVGCRVRLEIFNVAGQRVEILLDRYLEAGEHQVIWNTGNQASGVYIYRLTAGDFEKSLKMILMK